MLGITNQTKTNKMSNLESTKAINKLKLRAIKNGGYAKHATKIMKACELHLSTFGVDHRPKQLIK